MALYKAQSRRLFAISYRIVRDDALAEEIMQDTLLKFLSTADALASGSPQATGRTQPQRSEDGLGRGQVADRGDGVQRSEDGSGLGENGLGRGQGRRESAWLTKTCVRASIDALRKMRRELEFLDEYAGVSIEDCGEENGGGFVFGVLGDEFALDGFLEDAFFEGFGEFLVEFVELFLGGSVFFCERENLFKFCDDSFLFS